MTGVVAPTGRGSGEAGDAWPVLFRGINGRKEFDRAWKAFFTHASRSQDACGSAWLRNNNQSIETAGAMQRLNLVVHQLSELDRDTGLLPVIFQEIGPPMSAAETTLDVLTLHAHQP